MGGEGEDDPQPGENLAQTRGGDPLLLRLAEGRLERTPLRGRLRVEGVGAGAPDAMVLLGEVDELEVGREGADDRLGLPLREVGEHLPQALRAKLALPRRSASPQDGELADLLLEEEEALTG